MRNTIARLGLTALFAAGGLAVTSPAQAAGCADDDGVTVLVQHEDETTVECADGDPETAGEALESAGFEVEKVQSDAQLLCTIDGTPETSCAKAPEAETFWAFFTASDGGSWEFADKGVFAYDPEPGTTLGFRFGDGAEPSMTAEEAVASEDESTAADGTDETSDDSAAEDEGSGALVPTVIGFALVAVLAVGGFLVSRRRKS